MMILGRISIIVQCVKNGFVYGNFHIKADHTNNLVIDSVVGSKMSSQFQSRLFTSLDIASPPGRPLPPALGRPSRTPSGTPALTSSGRLSPPPGSISRKILTQSGSTMFDSAASRFKMSISVTSGSRCSIPPPAGLRCPTSPTKGPECLPYQPLSF